jgi:hypothetical protein
MGLFAVCRTTGRDEPVDILDKEWQVYVGQSWIGTLTPTGADDEWYYADFSEGDAWGNFAPWFKQAVDAFEAEDDVAWQGIYSQLIAMGLEMRADDGETYTSFTLYVDGDSAWFVI